ncbi:hypothetical protein ALC53_07125 [Atta colombica]|uniref:Uncharacterized protein n=1 Tax=Atta colombica TaxID=520822 RepID=A0A195BDQ3_9HYME|nr:hypothetical protein ALC53_07125 [Atta colombica]
MGGPGVYCARLRRFANENNGSSVDRDQETPHSDAITAKVIVAELRQRDSWDKNSETRKEGLRPASNWILGIPFPLCAETSEMKLDSD